MLVGGNLLVSAHPKTPSPLRERAGVRVQPADLTPPHLTTPPQGGEETVISDGHKLEDSY
jgi:hypothetical protein